MRSSTSSSTIRMRAWAGEGTTHPNQQVSLSFQRHYRGRLVVISTGRRNTLVKSLCWRLEVQRFPGPLVELACHLVQLGLGVPRKIKAPGEVLAQQAIGVFA